MMLLGFILPLLFAECILSIFSDKRRDKNVQCIVLLDPGHKVSRAYGLLEKLRAL